VGSLAALLQRSSVVLGVGCTSLGAAAVISKKDGGTEQW
jgi:hypothetical protein